MLRLFSLSKLFLIKPIVRDYKYSHLLFIKKIFFMNLKDLTDIYNEIVATYEKDKSLTCIQVNFIFNKATDEKNMALINVDFRTEETKSKIKKLSKKRLKKNPHAKPQFDEKKRYRYDL